MQIVPFTVVYLRKSNTWTPAPLVSTTAPWRSMNQLCHLMLSLTLRQGNYKTTYIVSTCTELTACNPNGVSLALSVGPKGRIVAWIFIAGVTIQPTFDLLDAGGWAKLVLGVITHHQPSRKWYVEHPSPKMILVILGFWPTAGDQRYTHFTRENSKYGRKSHKSLVGYSPLISRSYGSSTNRRLMTAPRLSAAIYFLCLTA